MKKNVKLVENLVHIIMDNIINHIVQINVHKINKIGIDLIQQQVNVNIKIVLILMLHKYKHL